MIMNPIIGQSVLYSSTRYGLDRERGKIVNVMGDEITIMLDAEPNLEYVYEFGDQLFHIRGT